MHNTHPQAAIYARSATTQEGIEPFALASQIAACRKYATENGYQVSEKHIYQEVTSGLEGNRPILEAALWAVKNGDFTALIIVDYARLGRKATLLDRILLRFAEAGVTVIAITEPFPTLVLQLMADCIKVMLPQRSRRRKPASHTSESTNKRITSHR